MVDLLELQKEFLRKHIGKGSVVCDFTAGNGHIGLTYLLDFKSIDPNIGHNAVIGAERFERGIVFRQPADGINIFLVCGDI